MISMVDNITTDWQISCWLTNLQHKRMYQQERCRWAFRWIQYQALTDEIAEISAVSIHGKHLLSLLHHGIYYVPKSTSLRKRRNSHEKTKKADTQ